MKEQVFKVGYSTYIQKPNTQKQNWTSTLLGKITKHKYITATCLIIITCMTMNLWLIFKFVNILGAK